MNKNILIVLGGAVLVAVLVAMLVQVTLGGKKKETQEAKVAVLVASSDLSIGRELKEGDTRWQDWPQSSVFPGAIIREKDQKPQEALTGRLARDIAKGEPVVKSALLGQVKGNMVAASLEPGMRAMAIEVEASSMVGGFIGPGDFVDVMMTYKASLQSNDDEPALKNLIEFNLDKMATETILQNVKVLAVDQTAKRPDDDKIKVAKTVTLAVSAYDAERLFLAGQMGSLTLALRGVGDNATVIKDWPTVSDERLTSVTDEIFSQYQKLKEETGVNNNSVRIYSGEHISVVQTR
jgi:pilus assembly protein CpaB